MKTITINNEHFELGKSMTMLDMPEISRRDIDDVYARPSMTKVHIYNEWSNWFLNNDGYCGVKSYNSNFFTINGFVVDKESGKRYYCYITASHNRAYEIV